MGPHDHAIYAMTRHAHNMRRDLAIDVVNMQVVRLLYPASVGRVGLLQVLVLVRLSSDCFSGSCCCHLF